MNDIKEMDLAELLKDREESLTDIHYCRLGLLVGLREWSGGPIQNRLETSERIVEAIDKELLRRGVQIIITG